MKNYLDIKLLPDEEISSPVLMNAIYTKLHKALCDRSATGIGVSFPKYKVTLGNVLRLHGNEADLIGLQDRNWLGGMSGYCNISDIQAIPSQAQHRTVSRIQTTMSQSKLNRLIKRGSISEEDIKQYRAKIFTKGLDNPYIELASASNGHKHRRYIQFGELQPSPVAGKFDNFGLSKTATVPWF